MPPARPETPASTAAAAPAPTPPAARVDPLTAPLNVLLGQPLAADPDAPALAAWPCVECGASNPLDSDTCSVCTAPFGGRIARVEDPKATRRKVLLVSLGAVATFLMVLAALTFASTGADVDPGPDTTTVDFSTLPAQ